MNSASGDVRYAAIWATSRGVPSRAMACAAENSARISSVIPARIGVSIVPGAIELMVMPQLAYSVAACRVIAVTPPFAALYEKRLGSPLRAASEAILRIRPYRFSIIEGITVFIPNHTPLRSMPITLSHSASSSSTAVSAVCATTPAMFAKMSMWPWVFNILLTCCFHSDN